MSLDSFIAQHGYPPTSNTSVTEYFCIWCQSEAGEVHSLSCPLGERYKYFQLLGQSGISIDDISKELGKNNIPFYTDPIHTAASTLGRKGGQSKSPSKSISSRLNGKKGGRPKGKGNRNKNNRIEDLNIFD